MNISNVKLFIKVVELGSFIRAAEYCDIPRPTISRNIKSLEDSLGARLLDRTTRKLSLTEIGEEFYLKALHIIGEIEQAEREIASKNGVLSGKLTVFSPVILADICSQHIADFHDKYPNLMLNFKSVPSGQVVGEDKPADLHLHIGQPKDSTLIGVHLADVVLSFYASPSYIEKYDAPSVPEDLKYHKAIYNEFINNKEHFWKLGGKKIALKPVTIVDSLYLSHSFACQGLGITMLPKFLAQASVNNGELVELFSGRYESSFPVYGLYPSRRFVPAKVSVLIEHIKSRLKVSV